MHEGSRAPQSATDAPPAAPEAHPGDWSGHTPAPLTDADVDHALGAYGASNPFQPGDHYDAHAADAAFGAPLTLADLIARHARPLAAAAGYDIPADMDADAFTDLIVDAKDSIDDERAEALDSAVGYLYEADATGDDAKRSAFLADADRHLTAGLRTANPDGGNAA